MKSLILIINAMFLFFNLPLNGLAESYIAPGNEGQPDFRVILFVVASLGILTVIIILFILLLRKRVKVRTAELQRETYLNYYIADLSRKLLADMSIDNISKVVLEYLTELTSSSNGLAGFVDKNDPGILTPYYYEKRSEGPVFRKVTLQSDKIVSLMVSVLEKRESFFVNDPKANPDIHDFPEGHIDIRNYMSSPAIIGDEAVGFILLANSSRKYGSADINIIENFSSQYALAIQRMWFEHDLVESEMKYRDMFDNVADMLYIYDLDGNILDANKTFTKMFSYITGDIRKLNIIEVLSGGSESIYDKNFIINLLEKVKTRGYLNGEVEVKNINGEKRILEFKNSLITDETGKPKGVRGSARDITDRKMFEKVLIEAKEKASDSDRLKSNFIANMSHEIRTPLNAILGFTDMLIEEVSDRNHKNYLGMIQNSGKLLLSIIDDILDISKIESGALKISTAPFNVRTLMLNAYNRGAVLLKNKSKDVEFLNEIDPGIPEMIYGDGYRIEQVLNNLIMNAVKFTANGMIKVGLKLRNDYSLEFSVEDTGIGIAPENVKMIFERFRQVDGDSRRSFGGTGLGLAISKMIVELMGGNIYVKSEAGHGSKFIFTVPYRPAFEKETAAEKPPEKRRDRGNRIMVVEDNSINRTLVARVLEKRGYTTLMAVDGFEAVNNVKSGKEIDLILMDIQMPGMDGMEALKLIREIEESSGNGNRVPVIALSAHVMKDDVEKFLNSGFDSYVAKPFNSNDLTARIESLLK
ncbi:MAG TPA: ATP-binding protein [Spirochaetota bacterium]|nr:ATP-binding protein [Spirochaetota bacterium]